MKEHEKKIQLWFEMWLRKDCTGIEDIFSADAVYTESWGPKYNGINKIEHWFNEWNTRGDVVKWDIKRFFHNENATAVEWYFKNTMKDGRPEEFDGVSLIEWNDENKIISLKEFGCNINNYDPYKNGCEPEFKNEDPLWF